MSETHRINQRRNERKYNLRRRDYTTMYDGTEDYKFSLEYLASVSDEAIEEDEHTIRRLTKRAVNAARHRK